MTIGTTSKDRSWIVELQEPLKRLPNRSPTLLGLTVGRYNLLFRMSRELAKLPYVTPHSLRHGGVSADALQEGACKVEDLTLRTGGPWAAISSVQIYRKAVDI